MEWQVVTVIIALVSFAAIIIRPVVSLTKSITELTTTVKRLQFDLDGFVNKNSESHARLWNHNNDQDLKLEDHEARITIIENRK